MHKIIILLVAIIVKTSFCFAQTDPILKATDERGYYVKIGDIVPDIEFSLIDGNKISLNQLKGKIVMLQFTASWCKVCRSEMPYIEAEIWQEYKDKGLMIIGVDYDEPLEKVVKFKEQMKVTYPLALDPNADIFEKFAAKNAGVTRNVILDREGKILFLTRLFDMDEFNKMKLVIKEQLADN